MSNFCSECGKPIADKIYPNNTCQACYNYFRKGGTVSPLPAKGTIAHDHRGFVVCHICGRAYQRLGSHYHYEMPQRLQETGKGTRIKVGEKHLRYGKKSRLQECLDRKKRYGRSEA